jgi:hypothetical protein
MEVASAAGVQHFCRVVENEVWLLKCGAGTAAHKGILERSQIVEKLKNKLRDVTRNTASRSGGVECRRRGCSCG